MSDIHSHYSRLNDTERGFVDDVFDAAFRKARHYQIDLPADDRIERAVDALARAIIEANRIRAA